MPTSLPYFEPTSTDYCFPEVVTYFGWSLQSDGLNDRGTSDAEKPLYRIIVRLTTSQTYNEISDLVQLNSSYDEPSPVPVSLNGSSTITLTPRTGFSQWILEGESIQAMEPYGCGVSSIQREYSSLGPWKEVPYSYSGDEGNGLVITSDKKCGLWFDNIEYSWKTDDTDNEQGETGTTADVLQTETRVKMLKVHAVAIHDNITALAFPSTTIPIVDAVFGVYNFTSETGEYVQDKYILPIDSADLPYTNYFIVDGQDLIPYDSSGGKMMKLTTHYGTLGALQEIER